MICYLLLALTIASVSVRTDAYRPIDYTTENEDEISQRFGSGEFGNTDVEEQWTQDTDYPNEFTTEYPNVYNQQFEEIPEMYEGGVNSLSTSVEEPWMQDTVSQDQVQEITEELVEQFIRVIQEIQTHPTSHAVIKSASTLKKLLKVIKAAIINGQPELVERLKEPIVQKMIKCLHPMAKKLLKKVLKCCLGSSSLVESLLAHDRFSSFGDVSRFQGQWLNANDRI